jgi:hypothetical protein
VIRVQSASENDTGSGAKYATVFRPTSGAAAHHCAVSGTAYRDAAHTTAGISITETLIGAVDSHKTRPRYRPVMGGRF